MMRFRLGPPLLAVALVAAAVTACPTCTPDARTVLRVAPGMDPEMARHLAGDDDAAFRRYCRGVGTVGIKSAMGRLGYGRDARSEQESERTWAAIAPYTERLSRMLATEFDCPDYLRDYGYHANLTAPQRWELELVGRDGLALNHAWGRLTNEERIARAQNLRSRSAALGDLRGVFRYEAALATCAESTPARAAMLGTALAHARSLGETYMPCQLLGELGSAYLEMGERDRGIACYEEALQIATHCRFPDQIVRILMFRAHYYVGEGRVALALNLVHEAQRVSHELGGGSDLRLVMDATGVFSSMECWEVVERLVDRSAVLIRERDGAPGRRIEIDWPWVGILRAQILMVRGDVEGAEKILRDLVRELNTAPDPRLLVPALGCWSSGLAEAGLPERSLRVIERGIALRDSDRVVLPPSFLTLRVQVLASLGRCIDAQRALDDLDRRRADWVSDAQVPILRAVAEARLRAAAGDTLRARAILRGALRGVHELARSGDSSTGSQLTLARFDELRLAAHEILVPDPPSGYRFEMEWRAMVSQVGRNPEGRMADGPDRAGAARRAASELPPPGVVHCVFLPLRTSTVRWTVTSAGVERDTLPLAREQARERVRQVLDQMTQLGDRPIAAPTATTLRDLATLLLPAGVLGAGASGSVRTLCISAEGPLAALPFEALNLSPGHDYLPLALGWDVARIRSLAPRSRGPAAGPPSIVADAAISAPTRRRFVIASRLDQAVAEANLAASLWPGAHVLTGAEAQKPRVLDSWRRAPRILLAAHLVRMPEYPFLGFIPLAPTHASPSEPDQDSSIEQSDLLDPADVRELDLSGCDLVVLSSCASGAPDLSARRVAPSFADAFLDAGARAVVQTMWPVEDSQARTFATGFLRATAQGGLDPVHALGEARRAAWRQGAPAVVWAGWSVGVLGFPGSHAAGPRALAALHANEAGTIRKLDRFRTELCENPHPIPRGVSY